MLTFKPDFNSVFPFIRSLQNLEPDNLQNDGLDFNVVVIAVDVNFLLFITVVLLFEEAAVLLLFDEAAVLLLFDEAVVLLQFDEGFVFEDFADEQPHHLLLGSRKSMSQA